MNMKVIAQLRTNNGASKTAFICGNISASIKSALSNVYPHRKFLLSEIVPTHSYPSAISVLESSSLSTRSPEQKRYVKSDVGSEGS